MIIHRGTDANLNLRSAERELLSHDLPMYVQRFDGRVCGPVVAFCALLPLIPKMDGDLPMFGLWRCLN